MIMTFNDDDMEDPELLAAFDLLSKGENPQFSFDDIPSTNPPSEEIPTMGDEPLPTSDILEGNLGDMGEGDENEIVFERRKKRKKKKKREESIQSLPSSVQEEIANEKRVALQCKQEGDIEGALEHMRRAKMLEKGGGVDVVVEENVERSKEIASSKPTTPFQPTSQTKKQPMDEVKEQEEEVEVEESRNSQYDELDRVLVEEVSKLIERARSFHSEGNREFMSTTTQQAKRVRGDLEMLRSRSQWDPLPEVRFEEWEEKIEEVDHELAEDQVCDPFFYFVTYFLHRYN